MSAEPAMCEEDEERSDVVEPELSDSGETVMSCETGTQYSAQDTSSYNYSYSYRVPDCEFSLELPVSLREEDCDWDDEDLTCSVCDRSFPTPVHLQAHMIKHRHWLCSHCEQLFNSSCELEYHKVRPDRAVNCQLDTLCYRTASGTGVRSTRLTTAKSWKTKLIWTVTRSLII